MENSLLNFEVTDLEEQEKSESSGDASSIITSYLLVFKAKF